MLVLIPILSGLLAILIASLIVLKLGRQPVASAKMAEIAGYIAVGVRAYLSRQLRTILITTPVLAVVLGLTLGPWVAVTFVLGVLTSLTTALLGMAAAVRANVRTAEQAVTSPWRAFLIAVSGGSVMGFSVIGFSLFALTLLYLFFRDPDPLVGFGFGSSPAALFAQIGGGIYTKSADVGADLVGKVEKNIPEDDPRNPAVIADLVGDNVGDCAGRGSDLFDSFSGDIITGTIIAMLYVDQYGPQVVFFPVILQSIGILSSMLGVQVMQRLRKVQPEKAFNVGMTINSVVAAAGSFALARFLLDDLNIFWSILLGVVTMLVASVFTRYYAGMQSRPVAAIAEASKRGVALNLITGIGYGLQSPLVSVVMIVAAVSTAYVISGGSLLAVVAVNIGTDLLIGYIMTADAFGPISDNAAGIAAMAGEGSEVVDALSALDAVGNTMKATTKSYAMASGTVTAFTLFATFFARIGLWAIDVSTPFSIAFIFLGISLPYLISSLVIGSTARAAVLMVDEVRRQFQTIPGLMSGETKPDYAACVDIATRNALKEMLLPGIISVAIPAVVGFAFGAWALGAFLIGAVAGSALLGPFFNNVGTAFDNAKKVIEASGQKDSLAYQAAVEADTVGDPLKDVAGPSLLILMKLIGMAALLLAGVVR